MRVTIALLGWTFDWTLEPTTATETETAEDTGAALNGGTTYATGMTYTGDPELPDEAAVPMRCNGWPDEDRRVGFR